MTTVLPPANMGTTNTFGVPSTSRRDTPPISDRGISRAFVRMLADAVERGDYAEAFKITRGAETHFAFIAAGVGR